MGKIFNRQYFIHSLAALLFMNIAFFMTIADISLSGIYLFIRKSIACTLAIYVMQLAIKRPFWGGAGLVALSFMAWWYLFLFWKFFVLGADIYEKEIFIGTYGAAAFMVLQYFCEKHANKRLAFFALDTLQITLCLPPVITYVHYMIYGYPIIYEEMLAVYNTSFRETSEWVMTYVGIGPALLLLVGIAFLWGCLGYWRSAVIRRNADEAPPGNKFLLLAVAVALFCYPLLTMSKTDCVGHFVLAAKYSHDIKDYNTHIAECYENIQFTADRRMIDSPHTIIMVIGESARRDYMRAYNGAYEYNDTPWLSEHKNDSSFILFTHAYACQSLTQQVLEHALTEKSYYNDKDFLDSMNIMDIARKKGYKTYWITDLDGSDGASTFSLVAGRADHVISIEGEYDDVMLEGLQQVNPQENNFVVLHGRGLHSAYKERYPQEMAVFGDDSTEAEYANAMNYVDDFLKQVYEYGRTKLNMQVMLYYSDHGENLATGHGPSDHDFDKVRIPMFLYLSPEYRERNRERYQRLLARKDSFYTNDMIYNTLSGIMNAESNYYDPLEDLSGEQYSYKLEDLWTFGKAVRVREDPLLKTQGPE